MFSLPLVKGEITTRVDKYSHGTDNQRSPVKYRISQGAGAKKVEKTKDASCIRIIITKYGWVCRHIRQVFNYIMATRLVEGSYRNDATSGTGTVYLSTISQFTSLLLFF